MIRRAPRIAVGVLALALAAGGCQLLVSSDLPEFRCSAADPSACPSGTVCDLAIGRCVADAGALDGGEEDAGEDALEAGDARSDQDAGPLPLGAPCRIDGDCADGLCGTSTILTPPITQGTGPICTKPCCTSAACPSGFVCFGAGTGGNYCVPAAKADRTPPSSGGKAPGALCNGNGECRSGYCTGGRCLDTCCRPQDCSPGTICRLASVNVPPPGHDLWVCAPPKPGADGGVGAQCGNNGVDCQNDACIPTASGNCRPPCCGKSSCASAGFPNGHCIYGLSNNDYFKFCLFSTSGTDLPLGASCANDGECQSDYCDPEQKKCMEICCTDGDCPGGQSCRPSAVGTPFLRCVGR